MPNWTMAETTARAVGVVHAVREPTPMAPPPTLILMRVTAEAVFHHHPSWKTPSRRLFVFRHFTPANRQPDGGQSEPSGR